MVKIVSINNAQQGWALLGVEFTLQPTRMKRQYVSLSTVCVSCKSKNLL